MAFAITALAVAAVGTIGSTVMSAKAAEETREARRASQRGEQFRAKRERVKQVREALVRQSQIENQAASQGVGGASGALAGVGSVASQAATNISDINSQISINRAVSRGYGRAAKYQQQAQYWKTAGSLLSSGFSMGANQAPRDPTLLNSNTGGSLAGPPQPGYRR
jgi:hypothetical protein